MADDGSLSELFELLRLAERAANRQGVREGSPAPVARTDEETSFYEAVASGRFRRGRTLIKDLADQTQATAPDLGWSDPIFDR
jgi:hypothetical protein